MFVESPLQAGRQPVPQLVGTGASDLAKPFLKWVGGKTQLIDQLDSNVPPELREGRIESYIEPFVGGGSFFFHVAQRYKLEKLIIADSNQDLILAYRTIRDRLDLLIDSLQKVQTKYLSLSESKRQDYYYETRKKFNDGKHCIDFQEFSDQWIERTAQLIFLNKTCFNGLFRVNAAGLFNVAFGRYETPKICDPNNLLAVSRILERTEILLGDFTCVRDHMNSKSFAYLDPPYRPITATSNFTAYSSSTFTADDQKRLADFCREADGLGSKLMISNSDPENSDSTDTYFQDNYPGYRIVRAFANRMVNCKADKRGKISELIIMNYPAKATTQVPDSNLETESAPPRRSTAALGAFQLLHDCAKRQTSFTIDGLQTATGWKLQTARTYVSKKWKHYLEQIEGTKPIQFKVRSDFLQLTEQSFLTEFSQVLANSKTAVPQTIEDAREQALAALRVYADMLGAAHSTVDERKVRNLIELV